MANEDKLYHFRKQLLQVLPQRLNEDFDLELDLQPQLPAIEDEEAAVDDEQQRVISEYQRLLSLAISIGPVTKEIAPTPTDYNQWYDFDEFPLPPYDEVSLSPKTTEIRLLQLLPDEYDLPLVCRLFQIDSTEVYEYEALSYVWGSEERQKSIYVNDWEVPVTANLELALRSLRSESEPRLLWIDALCIDQSSIPEKTNQVSKMGDIYKAAKRVLVFLGPQTEASDVVCNFFDEGYFELPDLGQHDDEGALQGLQAATHLIEHHQPLVKAFVEVLYRPWFSRVWVRQEYIRAAQTPMLYCGQRHTDFPKSAFNLLCEAVFLLPTLLKQPMSDVIGVNKFHDVFARAVSVFQTMNSSNNYPQSIDSWLYNEGISGCQAKDPRDLIFSICALFDSVAGSVLRADYSQSIEDVFLRASAWMLMMEQQPKMLVQYPPLECGSTPSWVMDFTKARPTSRHHEFVATFDTSIFDLNEEQGLENNESDNEGEGHATSGIGPDEHEDDIEELNDQFLALHSAQQGSDDSLLPVEDDGALTSQVEPGEGEEHVEGGSSDTERSEERTPTDASHEHADTIERRGLEKSAEADVTNTDENQVEQEPQPNPEEDDEPPTIHCTVYKRTLLMPGIAFDVIEEVFEIETTKRIDAIRKLWHLEKRFQSDLSDKPTEIACLQNSAHILQWAVKLPINHMISTLVPRSEHYVDFLEAGLEDLATKLNEELLEDLMGALLFDFEQFEAEMRFKSAPGCSDSNSPRYMELTTRLTTSDQDKNEGLLDYLRELSIQILPLHLDRPESPPTPCLAFASTTASSDSGCDTSSVPVLHSQPRRTEELLQAWENEREDIFSQLFQSCCFFQTQVGFPGLGAFGLKGLKPGDVVTMLEGVPMPMVLRKCDGIESEQEELWKIVGPVVVRGIMSGEVKTLVKENVLERRVFRIK